MSAETDLYAALSGSAGLVALVGTRIWPDAIPEKQQFPAVVYVRASTNPVTTIGGQKVAEDVRFAISAWSETRTAAEAVADAIESALATAGNPIQDRSSGYDADVGLFAVSVEVDWFHSL